MADVEHQARKRRDPRRLTIEALRDLALSRGGACLSDSYSNNKAPLLWRCSEGHEWEANAHNIRKGRWCPQCFWSRRSEGIPKAPSSYVRLTSQVFEEMALARGGRFLGFEPERRVRLSCSEGHEWIAMSGNIRSGHWCPLCANARAGRILAGSVEDVVEIATSRGGAVVGGAYLNAHSPLTLRCFEGHEWTAPASNIRNGTWCPECKHKGEKLMRDVLEKLTGERFAKMRPAWLRWRSGRLLELDCINERLGIAFEYNGRQHYEKVAYFRMDDARLDDQRERDAFKRAECVKRSIFLVEVPSIERPTHEKMASHLAKISSRLCLPLHCNPNFLAPSDRQE